MKILTLIILLMVSNFAFGELSIDQTVKNGTLGKLIHQADLKDIEAILKNTDLKELFLNNSAWNDIIASACNLEPEAVLPLLQFAQKYEFKALWDGHELARVIENCDEETALFAVRTHLNLVPKLNHPIATSFGTVTISLIDNDVFKSLSLDLLTLLLNNGYEIPLSELPNLKNGSKVFDLIMAKNPEFLSEDPEKLENFISAIIKKSRIDFLEVLSKYEIKLDEICSDIDTKGLICDAVQSTRDGNHAMFNYVLDTFNAHGNPAVLACAGVLRNNTLFQNLLKKGYAADPNPGAETNIVGLLFAIYNSNLDAMRYFLEHGTDPNAALSLKEYHLPENIEAIEVLISYGFKINSLYIATAAQNGYLKLIKYFKEKGYDTKHPAIFVAACGSENIELIDFLLDDGANIEDPSALASAVMKENLEVVQYLVEKGANPVNLMALNQAVKSSDSELKIAKYLVEKGAKPNLRSIINAGLGGKPIGLRWALEQTGTPITPQLEVALLSGSQNKIVKYTIEQLLPKDAILIGLTNEGYHFSDGIGKVASQLMENDPNTFIVPVVEEIASDDSLMIRFSGFINPGAGDSYPKHLEKFSFKDLDEAKLSNHEKLYQRVISFAKKYDIPYLGICLGNQYLTLNSDGYLQPVKDHGGTITIHFEKGSIPHFMTLLPHERAKALKECLLTDISAEKAVVAHNFGIVKDSLGKKIKLGAISGVNESIPQAIYHGHNQIGVQFHPERAYFQDMEGETNRYKVLLDSFFGNTLSYQKSRSYALKNGFDYFDARDSIREANQKLINHLEACTKNKDYPRNEHFWGQNMGSEEIIANSSIKDASVNILTGLTPHDLALARNGDDLILIIKNTGEMLSIESHFAPSGEHRVKSIDFADGSRLMLNHEAIGNDGLSEHVEDQGCFYPNGSAVNALLFGKN